MALQAQPLLAATKEVRSLAVRVGGGGGARECDCAAPLPCPRGRVLRTLGDDSDADAAEEADWTLATDGWPRR